MIYSAILYDPQTLTTVDHRFEYDACADPGCWYKPAHCPDEHVVYQWTDGNYSCDCNRLIFMAESFPELENDPRMCGSTIQLKRLTNLTTGTELRTEEL